jgi:hypothetical protein
MLPCRPLRLAVTTLALAFAPTLAACDIEEPGVEVVSAETFEEGVAKDSDGGAFRVVLTTEDGLEVGENTLVVRLGFHDPDDPAGPGRGIPGADVRLEAWMPYGDGAVSDLRGVYLGDGEYAVEVDLPERGIWQMDFDLRVGDGISDSVSFAFIIGE